MNFKRIQTSLIRKFTLVASALILIASSILTTGAEAKQGVFVNATVYFTLDNALLTAGTTTQTFSFTVNLINQSAAAVDLNQFGVRVLDKDGNKYSARLVEKASARVQAKQTQSIKYTAQVPTNMTLRQLSVNLFAWDNSSATFMRNLGSLDASSATITKAVSSNKEATINLSKVDAALPASSSTSFELIRSYKVLKNDIWYVYSDVMAENLSAKAIKLPANLVFNLRAAAGQTSSATIISGANQTILSKQLGLLTIQGSLANLDSTGKLSLELTKKSASASQATSLLGSLSIDDTYTESQIGTNTLYTTKSTNALNMIANRTEYTYSPFSNEIAVDYTLVNEGQTTQALPVLSALYQVNGSTLAIAAVDKETHPLTLAPSQSTTYHFTAEFPKATDTSTIELVVMEKASSGSLKPINLVQLPESFSLDAESGLTETTALDMKDLNATLSKHSMLSFQVERSYHTTTDGKALINIEVLAKNQSASTLKLPTTLGYTLYDNDNLAYPTTILSGGEQSIVPHQSIEFTLQAAIGVEDKSKQYRLQLVKKAVASTNSGTAAGSDTTTTTTIPATEQIFDTLDLASSFSNTKSNSLVTTSIGKLAVTLKSTYRLASAGSDDILVSELEIQNVDSKTITLPNPTDTAFYGGYRMGDLDAQGKVVQIQSSAYLYPNQKTTVYIYAKIPYTSIVVDGYIYLGDGTWNAQASTWSATHEWTEIPYTVSTSVINKVTLNNQWSIATPGRTSLGEVADSQIYDINNQKMLAVRILQTNKEARNGSIIPYTGYLTNADGTILALKTTDDSANTTMLSKEGLALTTLWAVLPTGLATDNQQFIFGQKINENVMASPQQYAFTPSTTVNAGSINNVAVYPYTLSVQNAKLESTTIGTGANSSLGYNINFDYTINKAINAAGSLTNRSLVYKLVDNKGAVIKIWDSQLEGTDAWSTGKQKLSFAYSDIADENTFASYSKQLNIYEKFEGGTRLLGSLSFSF